MADLYSTIMDLIERSARREGGGSSSGDALYQPASVTAVNGDGTYTVNVGGLTVTANPETDLPLQPGQRVYVSEVRNGKPVVHGPR